MKISIKYRVVIEHLTKCWISQSVFNQLTCSWATFEGVIEGHKWPVSTGPYGPVFLRSFIWKFERPRLQSFERPVLVRFFSNLGLVLRLDLQALNFIVPTSMDYMVNELRHCKLQYIVSSIYRTHLIFPWNKSSLECSITTFPICSNSASKSSSQSPDLLTKINLTEPLWIS